MRIRERVLVGGFTAAVVVAFALLTPASADARTCESMGPNWFPSNQGTECDNSCSEACIVKWDCEGEACEPHHCWKCAAGSPPPTPPPPPAPDPERDAGGVRCDAMGEGWHFANQGNACNDNCSEACIPKWDCGGQPCRPHHCWKCAAGTPPDPPAPPSEPGPGGSTRTRLPNMLVDTNYHFDDQNAYVTFHVEALHSLEHIEAEFSIETVDGAVLAHGAGQDTHSVDVTLTVPLSQLVAPEVSAQSFDPMPIIRWVIRNGEKIYRFLKQFVKVNQVQVQACWPFDKWENNTCYYKAPVTKCGEAKCIKDSVTIDGVASEAECNKFAQVKDSEIAIDTGVLGAYCTRGAVSRVDTCASCPIKAPGQ